MRNILITSAGKRVSLVKIFQQELKARYPEGKVYTVDLNPQMAPAAIVSDGSFAVPRVTDTNYIPSLLDICLKHDIGVVIPTIDTELMTLASAKELFKKNSITVLVPDFDFVKICRDKRNTNQFFLDKNIRIPRQFDKANLQFPVFAKPYDGSLSKDIYLIHKEEELTPAILDNPKLLFMEYINPAEFKEFTVDLYYGADNQVKGIVPRERIEIRAGEINKGYTRKNEIVSFLKERLNNLPGVVGCICLQLFFNEQTKDIVGIEINPRFGGGFPLSYHAGANYAGYIIQEYISSMHIAYSDSWMDNTLMLRHDQEVIVYDKA